MVSNNYHWGSERGQPKKKERHEIDAFTMLVSKVHVLFLKVNRLQPTPIQNGAASGLYGQVSICEMCGVQGHNVSECHLGLLPQDLAVEQANTLYNFNARPHNDPYSTTHNLGVEESPKIFL